MYKKILVGVDGSEHSLKALEEAVTLANFFKAELQVFHAIKHHFQIPVFPLTLNEPLSYNVPTMTRQISDEQLNEYYLESGKQIIEQAKKRVDAIGVKSGAQVVFNLETNIPPAEFAETYAKEKGIDLIVVGCKGHHTLARKIFLGTVASKIMNDAPCNVLVVR